MQLRAVNQAGRNGKAGIGEQRTSCFPNIQLLERLTSLCKAAIRSPSHDVALNTLQILAFRSKGSILACMLRGCPADLQLEDLRVQLDEKGLAIAERQEASVSSRRKLAETTKGDFVILATECDSTHLIGGWHFHLFRGVVSVTQQ